MKNLILLAMLLLTLPAMAGTKRAPANADRIPCLNAVDDAFNKKWQPVRSKLTTESKDLSEKEKNNLQLKSRTLLLAKSGAIQTCTNNNKNIQLKKILQPFD